MYEVHVALAAVKSMHNFDLGRLNCGTLHLHLILLLHVRTWWALEVAGARAKHSSGILMLRHGGLRDRTAEAHTGAPGVITVSDA